MSEHVIKRHNKNLMLYHLVCPIKYRRKVLTEDVEEGLKQICLEIEKCYEIGYVEIGADEDHVHFLIQSVPSYLPSAIVQTTKSITAKQIFIRFPEVKRMLWGGKFWTSGYYINTVGYYGNEKIISDYVKNQGRSYKQIHRGTLLLFQGLEQRHTSQLCCGVVDLRSKSNVLSTARNNFISMDEDLLLIKKYKSGQSDAFGLLYDRYFDKIYRYVYYKVLNKDTTEDLVSDIFFKAIQKIDTFDQTKGIFSSWLYNIALNSIIDHYRSRKHHADIEDAYDLSLDERIEEKIDAKDNLQKVSEYLNYLSPKQREIVILRVWQEMPYKEIAEIIGGSEDSAKMAFSRAVKEIRLKFGSVALFLLFMSNFR